MGVHFSGLGTSLVSDSERSSWLRERAGFGQFATGFGQLSDNFRTPPGAEFDLRSSYSIVLTRLCGFSEISDVWTSRSRSYVPGRADRCDAVGANCCSERTMQAGRSTFTRLR